MRYEIIKKSGKFVVEVDGKQSGAPSTSIEKAQAILKAQRKKDRDNG